MNLETHPVSLSEAGYSLLQTLTVDRVFLCTDVSSNIVVLKRLDDDCLYRTQLHPSIKERLAKVRQLPHPRLATLRGVERWQGMACLVWTWLDGDTWDDATTKPLENFGALASALAEAVDAMHDLGIVHGKLHGRNVIVRPNGQVWLTDISPYLYIDPAGDIAAVIAMLDAVAGRLPAVMADRLGHLLDEMQAGKISLRELARSLRGLDEESVDDATPERETGRNYRTSSLVALAAVALLGAGVIFGIHRYYSKTIEPIPTTFPSLKPAARG